MVALCVWTVFHGVPLLDEIIIAVIVLPTLWSGVEYFVKNRGVLGFGKPRAGRQNGSAA